MARVTRSYDVGGGYGQSSEKRMMKEILRNGALNTEFQAPSIFQTYKSGLLTEEGFQNLSQATQGSVGHKADDISDRTINDKGIAW